MSDIQLDIFYLPQDEDAVKVAGVKMIWNKGIYRYRSHTQVQDLIRMSRWSGIGEDF